MKKFVVMLFLTGCATSAPLEPFGGSKADGIVQFSHEYGVFRKAENVVTEAVMLEAQERCKAWGFNSASYLGEDAKQCTYENSDGVCMRYRHVHNFQCY